MTPDSFDLDRRTLLRGSAALDGGRREAEPPPAFAAPAVVRGGRPELTHGVQSGDVTADTAPLSGPEPTARPGCSSTSPTPTSGAHARSAGPLLTPDTDRTGKCARPLRAGHDRHYRVTRRTSTATRRARPAHRAASGPRRPAATPAVHLVRRPRWPGLGHQPRARRLPDLPLDARPRPGLLPAQRRPVYADGPLPSRAAAGRHGSGATSSPRRSPRSPRRSPSTGVSSATTCSTTTCARSFAGCRRSSQWDDHEVINNWYPGEILDDSRYTEKRVDVLAARAPQAFHEYLPIATPADRRAHLPQRLLRPAARRVRARHAHATRTRTPPTRDGQDGGCSAPAAAWLGELSGPARPGRSSPPTCRSA